MPTNQSINSPPTNGYILRFNNPSDSLFLIRGFENVAHRENKVRRIWKTLGTASLADTLRVVEYLRHTFYHPPDHESQLFWGLSLFHSSRWLDRSGRWIMSSGLIALLDDIAALAKVAAASLDDAGAQAAKASGKAAGIVIDDAAVTPRYVVGLAADRELPIIYKIAIGSLKNKFFFLLPGALALSLLAPWAITPLLMAGGAFLCLEGYHKVMDLLKPGHHGHNDNASPTSQTPQDLENERVGSAIRTDFILSAEIMAITLDSVTKSPIWLQGGVLAVVGIFMTFLVYGVVAIIVKADDVGVALAKSAQGAISALGRGIVIGMPFFLKTLSMVGMIAMLWVGGGILNHGLHDLGVHGPEAMVHHAAKLGADAVPALGGLVAWLISASIAAVLGLLIGAVVNPLVVHFIAPTFARLQSLFRSGMKQKSE